MGKYDLGSNNEISRARRIRVKYGSVPLITQVEVTDIDSVDLEAMGA